MIIIIIVIIIKEKWAVQGWTRESAFYQSEDPNPTQQIHGRKKMRK